nr:MAG: DNA methylase [Bacteriophage sp.]
MKIEKCGNITLINGDCMEFMQSQSDKSFDLAIVDPPYGINYAAKPARSKREKNNWDNDIPNDIYFDELFRISNKCIIWGGNYYKLLPCQCFIFWYKQNPVPNFSDGEFAWTNFNCPAKCFDYRYYGNLQGKSSVKEKKIHPTQKPIILYEWLLQNFAEPGQRILDTHGGSMSHAIAAHKLGFDLTIIEKDPVYYEQAKKRLIEFQRQQVIF